MTRLHTRSNFTAHWTLDPEVVYLNHGSFGGCPVAVIEAQREIRARIERQPVQFFTRDWEGLLDAARERTASFLGAEADDLVFVPNATAGVNTVLRSLRFEPGDELLMTDHEYNACANALRFVADRARANVVTVSVPFPIRSADDVVRAILESVTPRTRLALIDHVTSPTALIFPIERIVRELQARGVETLVDGAHAPGMVPIDLRALGAAYYTGNLHKWTCAPKGAAFLHVRRDLQDAITPLSISHGLNSPRRDRSRFRLLFDWTGTTDPSAWLTAPVAIAAMEAMLPGGWRELRSRNRELVLAGRALLENALGVETPAPEEMIGSMASIPLPDGPASPDAPLAHVDPMQEKLLEQCRIEVPVPLWPAPPRRLVRISAQLYNGLEQYDRLTNAVIALLEHERLVAAS